MYRSLAHHIATHPRRIIGGWAIVIVLTATLALWGCGTPLFDRLHSDLPQEQNSQSYRGNAILTDAQPGNYSIIAALDNLDLGDDVERLRHARAELTQAREDASAAGTEAKELSAQAQDNAQRAQRNDLDPAERGLAAQRARELGARAQQAGDRAREAAHRAEEIAALDTPHLNSLSLALEAPLRALAAKDGVLSVHSPFLPANALLDAAADDLINASATRAAIVVTVDADDGHGAVGTRGRERIDAVVAALENLQPRLRAVAGADATVKITHQRLVEETSINQLKSDLVVAESVGIPVSVLIMVLVFGGVLAALMPAAGALVAVSSALAVMLAMTYVAEQQSFAVNVISILGLGLSIDYGLLILSRYREELATLADSKPGELSRATRGVARSKRAYVRPLELTLASAGRTVLFSAVTVAVAILGMLTFTPNLLRSLGIAGVTVVVLAAACALTLVPALAFLASARLAKPPRWRLARAGSPHVRRHRAPGTSRWYRLGHTVNSHPWPFLVLSVLLLGVCIIPVGHLQLRNSMFEMLALDNPQRVLLEEFSDVEALSLPPIEVVAHTDDTRVLRRWGEEISQWPEVREVSQPREVGEGYTRVSVEIPSSDRGSPQAEALVAKLRAHPPEGVTTYVTGQAAQQRDFVEALSRGLPWCLAVVIGATFVLLFAMTRSVIVPIKALAINSFSLLAALGISTWVFQDGHGVELLGATRLGGLESYVVVMMACIGFGLSMDYEVFLLARMRETYVLTGDNDRAVVQGLAHSGRIITSAAGILVCVFLAFCLSSMIALKQVGFVMAVAVALDATIVRLFLVPSLMTLFGNLNWWAPRWLWPHASSEIMVRQAAGLGESASEPTPARRRSRHARR